MHTLGLTNALCVHPEVQSGTGGRVEPPDWLEQVRTHGSLRKQGAAVNQWVTADNHMPISPVSQSASDKYSM